ncbi:MAG: DedA family protein [Planctomycetaceae bacterium]|nr:DedA family protein [Planctomycetaceae bacterium]
MEFIDFFLHIDRELGNIVSQYGIWTYVILFLVIFCETGLVVTPFLPGDSLLFAAGAIASSGSLHVHSLFLLLLVAAIAGDTVNYHIGYFLGPKFLEKNKSKFIKKEYLERTHQYFEKYGGKTIIIARFVPIVRTFAPFLAGIGSMTYRHFISYNIIGALLWVSLFTYTGYFFGKIPFVEKNFTLVILAIIVISIMPAVIEVIKAKREMKKPDMTDDEEKN